MSSTDSKQSAGFRFPKLTVGLVLAIGGTALSVDNVIPFTAALKAQGLELDFGMTLATIGVLLVMFPIINSFFVVPLQDAIRERNTNLENTFSEAEDLRAEMTRMRAEYEKRIALTESQARDQIQSQIREAQNLRSTLMDEATQKTQALIAQAEQEIAAERDRLIGDLRSHVVDLALAAAEKVVRENMDTDRNRRMIDDFISRAEVAS